MGVVHCMVVLTEAEVRAYCLGIAQLIPLLIIALFVLDTNQQLSFPRKGIGASSSLENEARMRASSYLKEIQEANQELEETDKLLNSLDADPRYAITAFKAPRLKLEELRAQVTERVDQLTQRAETWSNVAKRMPEITAMLHHGVGKMERRYVVNILVGIVIGIAGEVSVLWGALGLIAGSIAISLGTSSAIIIIGLLGVFAIERLLPEQYPKASRFVKRILTFSTVAVVIWTDLFVVISVAITH